MAEEQDFDLAKRLFELQDVLCEAARPWFGVDSCPCGLIIKLLTDKDVGQGNDFYGRLGVEHLDVLEKLAGPHGYTVYKMLLIKCEEVT